MPENDFCGLVRRVRAGDEQAAADLVKRYEPALRRAVRLRLRDSRLRRVLDSMDVCQSVFCNFFVRVAAGQFQLDRPEQLLQLLTAMARNNVINLALYHQAERRDCRRVVADGIEEETVLSPSSTPSGQVAAQELLQEAQRRLSLDERQLLELRQQGLEWSEVAAELGGSPEGLRKQLTRAIDRVALELGLAEVPGE
jgi:RNA polymerase sigma-70 factor (ECF subfamily)